jgi:hypothetical protein
MNWYAITLDDLIILLAGLNAGGVLVLSFALTWEWIGEMQDDRKGAHDGREDY